MKLILIILLLFLLSCGYPDIDSVPEFKNLNITQQEYIDLCNLSYTDKKKLTKCLNEITKKTNK